VKCNNKSSFDEVLLEAIDEALIVIGEPAKKILYFHIQSKYLLKPENISSKPELFILALKNVLGEGGCYVETLILKKICEKYHLDNEIFKSMKLEEAIEKIRLLKENYTKSG
jgi:hypothetical protein